MDKLLENQSCYEDEEDNITAFIESNLGVYFYDQIGFHYLNVAQSTLYCEASLHKTNKKLSDDFLEKVTIMVYLSHLAEGIFSFLSKINKTMK